MQQATFATHQPVMLDEVLELLNVQPDGHYCDATLGGGGHARAVLERSAPRGRLLGIDRDPAALAHCAATLADYGDRITLRHANYAEVEQIWQGLSWPLLDGVVADLGTSTEQLTSAERGFSLANDGPLDMRMDPASQSSTAQDLIAELTEEELAVVLRDYGEERQHRRLARAIKQAQRAGQLETTAQLRDLVVRVLRPPRKQRWRIHPATRTFQALRIAVNDELAALRDFLGAALGVLRPGGVLAVIAFHSLEDREVKHHFRRWSQSASPSEDQGGPATAAHPMVRLLTKRPLQPSIAEVERNPRARSARLRAAEKLGSTC